MVVSGSLVLPGDEIASAEEILPGEGTIEERGRVVATQVGRLRIDPETFTASVERDSEETPLVLRPGDIVLGTIEAVRSSLAIVQVERVTRALDRSIATDTKGTLFVSQADNRYVESLEKIFRVGSLVRALVIEAGPSLQLSTKGAGFGILKAYCPRCRTAFEKQGSLLVCPECDWKDNLKMAADYGMGYVECPKELHEEAEPSAREPPRERRGERKSKRRPARGGSRGRRS